MKDQFRGYKLSRVPLSMRFRGNFRERQKYSRNRESLYHKSTKKVISLCSEGLLVQRGIGPDVHWSEGAFDIHSKGHWCRGKGSDGSMHHYILQNEASMTEMQILNILKVCFIPNQI